MCSIQTCLAEAAGAGAAAPGQSKFPSRHKSQCAKIPTPPRLLLLPPPNPQRTEQVRRRPQVCNLKPFDRESVAQNVRIIVLIFQEQLLDGQGTDGSPGILQLLRGWLGDGDGHRHQLGPGHRGRGCRELQAGGWKGRQGLSPREVRQRWLLLCHLQRWHHGWGGAAGLGKGQKYRKMR